MDCKETVQVTQKQFCKQLVQEAYYVEELMRVVRTICSQIAGGTENAEWISGIVQNMLVPISEKVNGNHFFVIDNADEYLLEMLNECTEVEYPKDYFYSCNGCKSQTECFKKYTEPIYPNDATDENKVNELPKVTPNEVKMFYDFLDAIRGKQNEQDK